LGSWPLPSRHSKNDGATTASAAGGSRTGDTKSASAGSGSRPFVPRQEAPVTNNSTQRSNEYDVQIKVTVEGLLLKVGSKGGACIFEGYRKFKNGENSPDSWGRPFKNIGDRIIAIDGINVERIEFSDIIKILQNNNNKRFRALRMREITKTTA
jgi:hypothetical protein